MTNSTESIDLAIKHITEHKLHSCLSTLYQLQPTIKAQRYLYARAQEYFCVNLYLVVTPQSQIYLTRLEKLIKTKKLTSLEKYELATIVVDCQGYINKFCTTAQAMRGYPEAKVDLFIKYLMVTPEENIKFCNDLANIVSLQQNKILSERLQLLV